MPDWQALRIVLTDIDGVMTDGRLRYGADGEDRKCFNARDGHLIRVALRSGLKVGMVSGRAAAAAGVRLRELGCTPRLLGVGRKHEAVDEWLRLKGIAWREVAFVGDDLPDLACLRAAGLAVVPADGQAELRKRADLVTRAVGGAGVLAEFLELLLRRQGRWQPLAATALHG